MNLADIITILTIIMALLPLFKDVKNTDYKGKNTFKKMSWSAYVLFVCAIAIILIGRQDSINQSNDYLKKQEQLSKNVSNDVNDALEKYHLKYDKVTGIINRTDSVFILNNEPQKLEKPFLVIVRGAFFVTAKKDDSADVRLEFKNSHEGEACNIKDKIILLSKYNGQIKILKYPQRPASNRFLIIPKNGGATATVTYTAGDRVTGNWGYPIHLL